MFASTRLIQIELLCTRGFGTTKGWVAMGILNRLFRTRNAFGMRWISVPQELIDVANTHDFCHYTINTRDGVASPPGLVSPEMIQKLIPFPDSEGYFHLDFPPFDRFELFLTPDNDVIFCTVSLLEEERVPLVTFASMLSLPGMKYSEKTITDLIQTATNYMPEEWIAAFKLNDVDNLFQG